MLGAAVVDGTDTPPATTLVTEASGPPLPVPPRMLVTGASGLPDAGAGPDTVPPSAATVFPVAVTRLPTPDTTGVLVCVRPVPRFATAPPTVCSRLAVGVPRPVVAPSVCVVLVTCEVSGTMAELACCVTCCTGPVDSVVPSDPPALLMACPTCETSPSASVVTGDSGCSGPVPRLPTRPPVAVTVLPVAVTMLPLLATVVPIGFGLVPMLPRPESTPVPAAVSTEPVLVSTSPSADWEALGTNGRLAPETTEPVPLTAPPAAVSTPPDWPATVPIGVVDAVDRVPEPVPVLPEPLPVLPVVVPSAPVLPVVVLPEPLPVLPVVAFPEAAPPEVPPAVPLVSPEPVLAQPPRISSPAMVAEISVARWIFCI